MKKAIIFRATGVVEVVDVPKEFDMSWVADKIGCDLVEVVHPNRLAKRAGHVGG